MGIPLGPLDPGSPAIQVLQNLPPKAKWWQLLLPRIFGDLVTWVEGDMLITMWNWRGCSYLDKATYLGKFNFDQPFFLPVGLHDEEYEAILESIEKQVKGNIISVVNTEALSVRFITPDPWISVEERLPDSGTMVLAYYRNEYSRDRRIRAFFTPAQTIEALDEDEVYERHPTSEICYLPEGWYEANEFADVHYRVDSQITHWMPLPNPPAEALSGWQI